MAISTLTSFSLTTFVSYYATRKLALPPRMIIVPSAAILGTWIGVFYGVAKTWRDLKQIPGSELVKRIESGLREEGNLGKSAWGDSGTGKSTEMEEFPELEEPAKDRLLVSERTIPEKLAGPEISIPERLARLDKSIPSALPSIKRVKRYNSYGDEIIEE